MAEGSDVGSLYSSTFFDFGAGFVSPSHAMDPGLVLSSGKPFHYPINLSSTFKFYYQSCLSELLSIIQFCSSLLKLN